MKKKMVLLIVPLTINCLNGCTLQGAINNPEICIQTCEKPLLQEISDVIGAYSSVSIILHDDLYIYENGVLLQGNDSLKYVRGEFITTEIVIISKAEKMTYKIGKETNVLNVSDSNQLELFLENKETKNG